jgi:hypothetical protein
MGIESRGSSTSFELRNKHTNEFTVPDLMIQFVPSTLRLMDRLIVTR